MNVSRTYVVHPHQAKRAPVMGKKKQKQTKEEKEEEDFNAMLKEFKEDGAKEARHATERPSPVCTRTFYTGCSVRVVRAQFSSLPRLQRAHRPNVSPRAHLPTHATPAGAAA